MGLRRRQRRHTPVRGTPSAQSEPALPASSGASQRVSWPTLIARIGHAGQNSFSPHDSFITVERRFHGTESVA